MSFLCVPVTGLVVAVDLCCLDCPVITSAAVGCGGGATGSLGGGGGGGGGLLKHIVSYLFAFLAFLAAAIF